MLKLIKVTGESLSPDYEEGDYVVVITLPFLFAYLKPGDIVVFTHETYGMMIKRVEMVDPISKDMSVFGNHPLSIDSRRIGPVKKKMLVGKVVWHIRRSAQA